MPIEAANLRVRSENPINVQQWVLVAGDDPVEIEVDPAEVCSVQVSGQLDGGDIDILGSIDGVVFVPIKDNLGLPVSFSDEGIATLGQGVRLIKPNNLLGKAGKVSVTIITRSQS